jgi:thiamine-monophosphate kinase
MKKVSLAQIGEFSLLKRLENKLNLKSLAGSEILVGIGDDAFAAKFTAGKVLVVTNDVLVENIHFRRSWMLPHELGYKALAVNLSDLAAMGGARPLYAFVGLAVPCDTSVDFVDKLYIGMNKACAKHGSIMAGGDTVSSQKDIVISITLLGDIDKERLISRSNAKPGDLIFVTGTFGDSGAGLSILEKRGRVDSRLEKKLIKKHLLPEPRLKTARLLSKTGKVTSMIDSSDGLAASLRFITEKSSCGANIFTEHIPLSRELRQFSLKNKRIMPLELALNAGEDYELVFTVCPGGAKDVKNISSDITCIGVINDSRRIRYFTEDKLSNINAKGYQAFSL